MKLSLCMIARDEECMLPGCLDSVKGQVDEVILVDTGSKDRTREVALRHGARVYDRPWDDDFSAPRNLALAHATGDWVLHLDADERMGRGSGAALRRAMRNEEVDCFLLHLHDASRSDASLEEVLSGKAQLREESLLPRLMRRTPDLAYRGLVHESVEEWVGRHGGRVALLDVHVVHFGVTQAARQERGKLDRNLRLLERRCREEPDSILPFGYLAMEYHQAERYEEARRTAEAGWALLDHQPRHLSAHLLGVARALAFGRAGELDAMRQTAEQLIAREGLQSDFGFLRGLALERMALRERGPGRRALLEEARRAYLAVLAVRAKPDLRAVIHGSPTWSSRMRLATVLLQLDRPQEALAEFRAARQAVPGNEEALLGEAEALLDLGEGAAARALLEPPRGERPDPFLLCAWAAKLRGRAEEARCLLRGARERVRAGYLAPHRAPRLLALVRSLANAPEESAELLEALMGRKAPPDRLHGAELDDRFLRRVAKEFLPAGRAHLLVPLLEPGTERVYPGLPTRMRAILAELGAEVVEGPQAPEKG